jgi:phosphoribosylformylglycinamidine cyclo-ligase
MIGPKLVQEGDLIIGLASSGLHSNGYSLVRRAYVDNLSDAELIEGTLASGDAVGKALLAPTKLYVKPLLEALEAGLSIHAAAHITGGGITENLNRALPAGLNAEITLDTWDVPEVITAVVEAAGIDVHEALKTFNMGIGMALICAPDDLAAITEHFLVQGALFRLGVVVKGNKPETPGEVIYKTR